MFVNSDFLHEYDFFALSTAGSTSRHGCFFTHDFLDLREKDKTFVCQNGPNRFVSRKVLFGGIF